MLTEEEKTYLVIPFEDKDALIQQAGKLDDGKNALAWDKEHKLFYARAGTHLEVITPYLPHEPVLTGVSFAANPIDQFTDILREAGFELHGQPIFDGNVHRVKVEGDSGSKKSGSYQVFTDSPIPAGWFQNFRLGDPVKWRANTQEKGEKQDKKSSANNLAWRLQQQIQRERKHQEDVSEAAKKATEFVNSLTDTPDKNHPYLVNKQVGAASGLKSQGKELIIPLQDVEGNIKTYQSISELGEKRLMKGGQKQGAFFVVGGPLKQREPILIAEGYATAYSIHQATQRPVVMAVDAGNLPVVAQALREKFKKNKLVICADNDHTHPKENKGVLKAKEAANLVKGHVIKPQFNDAEKARKLTDFNDLALSRGIESLAMINQLIESKMMKKTKTRKDEQHTQEETMSPKIEITNEPKVDVGSEIKSNEAEAVEMEQTPQSKNGFVFHPEEPANQSQKPKPVEIDFDKLIGRISHQFEENTVVYFLDGQRAFVDHGEQILMANQEASLNHEMILAAILVAKEHYHNKIEITGTDEFKKAALVLIAEHDIKVTMKDPIQQAQLDELRKLHQKDDMKNEVDKQVAKQQQQPQVIGQEANAIKGEYQPIDKLETPLQAKVVGLDQEVRLKKGDQRYVIKNPEIVMKFKHLGLDKGYVNLSPNQAGSIDIESARSKLVVPNEEKLFKPEQYLSYDNMEFERIQNQFIESYSLDLLPLPNLTFLPNGKHIIEDKLPLNYQPEYPTPDDSSGVIALRAKNEEGVDTLVLAKGDGHFLQGVVLRDNQYQSVIGKVCEREDHSKYIALNVITDSGIKFIGVGDAVRQDEHADKVVFNLTNEDKTSTKIIGIMVEEAEKKLGEKFCQQMGLLPQHKQPEPQYPNHDKEVRERPLNNNIPRP